MTTVSKELVKIQNDILDISNSLNTLVDLLDNDEIKTMLSDVREQIEELFLFVIVGEVKAGKSSFINALLQTEKDICKVAPSPMTDTIQQIVYGETEKEIIINKYLKKIYQNVEILKEISIVDTPGTNTIIEHHQEITEKFIPSADLIVFVFEAKNPYRESAWKFFDYIKEGWWKKVIFVLQQKDLLDENDLRINHDGVVELAKKKGIADPVVFDISAKLEKEGKINESGYLSLREYLDNHILNGRAPILKLDNNTNTIKNITNRISNGIDTRQLQYKSDAEFRDDIETTLTKQKSISSRQVDNLIDSLVVEYDKITKPSLESLKSGLSFTSMLSKSLGSTFGMNESPKDWLNNLLQELEKELNYRLKDKLSIGVVDIADSIQEMGNVVDLKIRSSKVILKDDNELFGDIATRRINILKDLQESFSKFLNKTDNFYDESIANESGKIGGNMAAATGITAVGVILAAVTQGMIFDITGGVLTGLGLVVAGVSLGFRRKKILKSFESELNAGRELFEKEISQKLKDYIENIKERIDANFNNFDRHLQKEKEDLLKFQNLLDNINRDISTTEKKLKKFQQAT